MYYLKTIASLAILLSIAFFAWSEDEAQLSSKHEAGCFSGTIEALSYTSDRSHANDYPQGILLEEEKEEEEKFEFPHLDVPSIFLEQRHSKPSRNRLEKRFHLPNHLRPEIPLWLTLRKILL